MKSIAIILNQTLKNLPVQLETGSESGTGIVLRCFAFVETEFIWNY